MNLGIKLVSILIPIVLASAIMCIFLTIRFLYTDIQSRSEKAFWLLSALFIVAVLTVGAWGLVNL